MNELDFIPDDRLATLLMDLKSGALKKFIFALDIAGAKALKEDGDKKYTLAEELIKTSSAVKDLYHLIGGTFSIHDDE